MGSEEWLTAMRFGLSSPRSIGVIKGVVGGGSPRQIMDDLRAEDPEAAMLLGEFIVFDDPATPKPVVEEETHG